MARVSLVACVIFLFQCPNIQGRFLVVPEDVAMLFTTIYGFAPPIHKGNDHRIGFGYRFGNHADFQVLYELGPQTTTKELQSIDVRSQPQLDRKSRRPLVDLLVRAGLVKDASYNNNVVHDEPK
ncbi:uncharacterized protein LOC111000720 [Pieris rapae]|uniref:uncharacterized protein LOC111000720 n=1 Tax=Pieris rapae TaxID=64459 RepID=UPI001E280AF6|nr:uncharacterized protein LOC111000720 [Pieris rapae]